MRFRIGRPCGRRLSYVGAMKAVHPGAAGQGDLETSFNGVAPNGRHAPDVQNTPYGCRWGWRCVPWSTKGDTPTNGKTAKLLPLAPTP